MTIFIDIHHPAHVHLFKNFAWEMKNRGHEVLFTASEKEMVIKLLTNLKLDFTLLGKYGNTTISKAINLIFLDIKLLFLAIKKKPDIYLGMAAIRASHVAWITGKKAYILTDTENAPEQISLFKPFATKIFTPRCFKINLGKKQIRYDGYHELAYLHPTRFKPDTSIVNEAGLSPDDTFFILRFVSWSATHDKKKEGLSIETKKAAISEMEKYGRVLISSENNLPDEFKKYAFNLPPEKMHHFIAYATLVYGESATMASEAAVLGTHAIFCDYDGRGYTDEQEQRHGLVFNYKLDEKSQKQSIRKIKELLSFSDLKEKGRLKREKLLEENIDLSSWLLDYCVAK